MRPPQRKGPCSKTPHSPLSRGVEGECGHLLSSMGQGPWGPGATGEQHTKGQALRTLVEEGEATGAGIRMGRLCLSLVTNSDTGGEAGQLCTPRCHMAIEVPFPFSCCFERKLDEGEIFYILSPSYGEEHLKDKTGKPYGGENTANYFRKEEITSKLHDSM